MEFTLNSPAIFPVGTTVGVYAASGWIAGTSPTPGSAPKGAQVTSGVVGANGVTFSGLTEKVRYYAAGEVSGAYRYVAITAVEKKSSGGGSSGTVVGGLFRKTVEEYGAKGDIRFVMDAGITAAAKILTSATAAFTAADVGKTVMLRGPGTEAAYRAYTAKIESVTDATHAVLTVAATVTVANGLAVIGTDDGPALKEAQTKIIEEALAKGLNEAELVVRGHYLVGNAPVANPTILGREQKGFSQIPLPVIDSKKTKFKLMWDCPGWGAPLQHWNQLAPQIAGPTLVSSLVAQEPDGTYHAASVLGGPTNMGVDPNGGDGFSNLLFGLKGSLTILTHRNPKHIGLDLRQVANADIENLSALTLASPPEMWTDVTAPSFAGFANGLRMPEFFNNDLSRVTSFSVEGFSFGVVTGDHCHIERLATIYCNVCLYTNPGGVQHGLSIGSWSAEYGQSIMLCEGQAGAKYPVTIQRLDVEEMKAAKLFVDAENSLRGTVQYAEQASAAPTKTGAEHLKITDNNNTA